MSVPRPDIVSAAIASLTGIAGDNSAVLDRLLRLYPTTSGEELVAIFRGLGRSPDFGGSRARR